ncbi:MAG: glycosyltransferase family 2 protein [Sporichthyaceae bacterium]|nr:glycosyltransferase family 2 protein [Sporichthyaceae bacterium]
MTERTTAKTTARGKSLDEDELVTVLVPARNEERTIGACLESILAQDYRNLQVVVVDGVSTDATRLIVEALAARDPRLEMITVERRSIPASLNAGLAAARGRWLVRVDAHSTVPADYVRLAVARLSEGCWGGVGGRKDGVGRTPAGRAIAAAMGSKFGVGNSLYHHGTAETEVDHIPFGAYPVDLARRVGGWDERLSANEDFEFDYRLRKAGERLLFDPDLAITWESRQSVRDLFRQYYRYGRGKADVAVLHPASLQVRHLAPPAFAVYGAVAGLIATARPGRATLMLLPYVTALVAASATTARGLDGPAERVNVPLAFLAMHVGWGSGFLSRAPRAFSLRSGRTAQTPSVSAP